MSQQSSLIVIHFYSYDSFSCIASSYFPWLHYCAYWGCASWLIPDSFLTHIILHAGRIFQQWHRNCIVCLVTPLTWHSPSPIHVPAPSGTLLAPPGLPASPMPPPHDPAPLPPHDSHAAVFTTPSSGAVQHRPGTSRPASEARGSCGHHCPALKAAVPQLFDQARAVDMQVPAPAGSTVQQGAWAGCRCCCHGRCGEHAHSSNVRKWGPPPPHGSH